MVTRLRCEPDDRSDRDAYTTQGRSVVERTNVEKYSTCGVGPDYTYWCQCPFWNPEDAAGLAAGLDPRAINAAYPEHCMAPASVIWYRKILELVRRAVHGGDLKPWFRPMDFLSWTRRVGIEIDAVLVTAIEDAYRRVEVAEKPESTRRYNIDLGMYVLYARVVHRWNPLSLRNTVAKDMADDCRRLKIRISESTIRDRLNEAKEVHDLQLGDT